MNRSSRDTLTNKVNRSLLSHVYHQVYLSQIPAVLCATVVLIGLYSGNIDKEILVTWYGVFWVVASYRILLSIVYFRYKDSQVTLATWTGLLILGVLLAGLCWGVVGSILFSQANEGQRVFIVLILAGIAAGGSPGLAPVLTASIVFMTSALLPTIVELFLIKQKSIYPLFDIAVVAYYIYLMLTTIRLHTIIKHTIVISFENEALLENLTQAKSQLELSNKMLEHAATHDPLTHIANRDLFTTNLLNAIDRSRENSSMIALLYLDLDNFKDVNDNFGHDIGDQVLLNIISRIKLNIREGDLVARWGGDEFTIILENIHNGDIVHSIAKQLCQVLSRPIFINAHAISITVSIGVSIYPLDGEDADSLLRTADVAMYYVKQHGRNQYQFSHDMLKA